MEIFVFFCIICLLFLSLLGSVLPILPGPLLSYIALLIYHFCISNIKIDSLIYIGLFVFLISIIDYFLQIYCVKYSGGSKLAIRGSIIGMILGFFILPPFGILIGTFIGAYIGAKLDLSRNPMGIAFGSIWGFIFGAIFKLCISVYIFYFLFFR
tara:strand:+ start:476 stop:937 length:462 start_codon:yes stop_codon:yes gene_type:complete